MSDTPRTDAKVYEHYEGDFVDADFARELECELAAARKENDTLRCLLGNSALPCTYCGLPAEDQAKCASGFPGCSRADDQMLSRHFADAYRADEAEKELAALRNAARELIAGARRAREYRSALLEVRAHLHATGRRPETCYEMSVIDAAIDAAMQEQKP